VHYPTPLGGEVATGTGWTCTASTVSDPTCTHAGGIAAGGRLPPLRIATIVPAQNPPAFADAAVSTDNPSDGFTGDNYTQLDTGITDFGPVSVIYGPACPHVMVLAVRGTGESPQADWTDPAAYIGDQYHGAGAVNWDLYTRLANAVSPGTTISLDPIMYPADQIWDLFNGSFQVYEASVASGAQTLLYDMQLTDFKCGGTVHYILTGYSQGAWVIHDALRQMTSTQLGEIAGMALFGDSDFKPFAAIVRDNKLQDINFGASAVVDPLNLSTPPVLIPHAGSWCYSTDPVCQASAANIATYVPLCIAGSSQCPHFQYVSGGETSKAATFLIPFLP
jgi:hypothetical protein